MNDKDYSCEICNKPFRIYSSCREHELICKLENGIDIEFDKNIIPILSQMAVTIKNLKEKVNELSKEKNSDIIIFKRHFIPEKWLSENCDDCKNFDCWLEDLSITNEQLHYIENSNKQGNYRKGVVKFLPEILDSKCPFKSFDVKKKKVYAKIENIWQEMKQKHINELCDTICERIQDEWKREKYLNNIENDLEYEFLLCGGKESTQNIQSGIMKEIYKNVNIKLTSLMVYEFKDN